MGFGVRLTLLLLVVTCAVLAVEDGRPRKHGHHHGRKVEEGLEEEAGVPLPGAVVPGEPGPGRKGDHHPERHGDRHSHHRRRQHGQHGPHHPHHTKPRSRWLPDWAAPWLKGSIDLAKPFSTDWDLAQFFNRESNEWWKGPNVCVTREESEEETHTGPQEIQHHHFSTKSSCDQTETSYMCTTEITFFGKKKYYTIVYECCHGFEREPGRSGCSRELDLKGLDDTAVELGAAAFVRALQGIGLDDLLLEGNFTVFTPTDETFKKFQPEEDIDNTIVIVNDEMTAVAQDKRALLLSHISPGFLRTSKFSDELLINTESPSSQIRINIYDVPTRLMTANCVPMVHTDKVATNGIVHVIDGVLQPIKDNLAELVAKDPRLSMFKTMMGKVGMVQTLKMPGQYTLFVPTNAAFKHLKPSLLDRLLKGSDCLTNLIRNHLLPNVICSSIIQGKARTRNDLDAFLNLTRSADNKLFVNAAQMISTDIMATNGVLHMIDEVLVPDSALDILDVAEKAGATEFLRLVEAAGMTKTLQSLDNYTLFLPSNEAVQGLAASVKKELDTDPMALERIIKFHVSPAGELTGRHFHTNLQLPTLDDSHKILIKEYFSAPFGLQEALVAQCAPIIKKDLTSCSGVAHMVGQMMLPPKGNVLDVLSQNNNFSRLVELLKASRLADDLQGIGPFTFFAPTNAALNEVNQHQLALMENDPVRLKGFLQNHIIKATLCCGGMFNNHWFWKQREWSLEGSIIQLSRRYGSNVRINRQTPVAECDLTASNGVIHAVNSVLSAAWDKYVIQHEREEASQTNSRLHHVFNQNWDQVWDHMREWDWLDMGWRSNQGRK